MGADHFATSSSSFPFEDFIPPLLLLCYKMAPMKWVPVTEVLVTIIFLHSDPVYVWPRAAMVVMVVLEYKKPGVFALPAATIAFPGRCAGIHKTAPHH